MSKVIVLGASGTLGLHVVAQALSAGHDVTAVARTPSKLPRTVAERVRVVQADIVKLTQEDLADVINGHNALINTAGHVTEGEGFVQVVAQAIAAVSLLEGAQRPRCWFLGGAAALDIQDTEVRAAQLPFVKKTYWPHLANWAALKASELEWNLLCPGPLVEQEPLGLVRMRIGYERMPVAFPGYARYLPRTLLVPLFAVRVPQLIISYADAASIMLADLGKG
ncbi:MAG TPA: NAD(P)H-binding protein, partial [Variovorax sp.]|nr:NAD(P)H-binding protein [Variovorax sp.]